MYDLFIDLLSSVYSLDSSPLSDVFSYSWLAFSFSMVSFDENVFNFVEVHFFFSVMINAFRISRS